MRHRLAFLAFVLTLSFMPLSARGQWQLDGVPISTAANSQYSPKIVSDGAGGGTTVTNKMVIAR